MPRRIPSVSPYSREALPFWRSKGIDMEPQIRALEPRGLAKWAPRIATAGVTGMLGAAAAPFLMGGGVASAAAPAVQGAATGIPTVAAPSAAGMFNFNNILRLGELGAGTVGSLLGQRSQNRALDRQITAQQQDMAAQMAYAREMEARRQQEFDRQQAALDRQHAADEAFRQKQWEAQEEERLYGRQIQEEREGRRRNYRSTVGDPALFRMAEILRLGGR